MNPKPQQQPPRLACAHTHPLERQRGTLAAAARDLDQQPPLAPAEALALALLAALPAEASERVRARAGAFLRSLGWLCSILAAAVDPRTIDETARGAEVLAASLADSLAGEEHAREVGAVCVLLAGCDASRLAESVTTLDAAEGAALFHRAAEVLA